MYKQDIKIPLVIDPVKPYTEEVESKTGSTISYHGIYYSVPVRDKSKLCGKVSKEILSNVSGLMESGLNAIMGPTGSGKTTLLDVLAGRKDKNRVTGHVLVDDKLQPKNFHLMAGYVEQENVLMGTTTVRETFAFSANLRLSKTITHQEKAKRVDQTIYELGLEKCADSMIGTNFIRGLSGGEKKRTSIGMELIVSPNMLFLDEPTTGLDATSANTIVWLLHRLAREGRTIIFSIHQPRYTIYELFDRLTVLGYGKTVYHGPASNSLDFFQSLGYVCKPFNNPADFLMDILHGNYGEPNGQPAPDPDEKECKSTKMESLEMESSSRASLCGKLAEAYRESQWHDHEMETLEHSLLKYQTEDSQKPEYLALKTSALTQFFYLTKRSTLNVARTPELIFMQVLVQLLYSVAMGTIFFNLNHDYPSGIQNRVGAFFLALANATMANKWALNVFFDEKRIYIHERAGGFYTVTPAFISKVVFDLIPMRMLPVAVSCAISYYMMGFRHGFERYFLYVLVVFLTSMCAATLAYMCSVVFITFSVASLGWTLGSMLPLLFSGLFINVSDIVVWLRWLRYTSYVRYALNALCINELKGATFFETDINGTTCHSGNKYLSDQDVPYETRWDLWLNIVGLTAVSVVYLLLAYIQLRRLKFTS